MSNSNQIIQTVSSNASPSDSSTHISSLNTTSDVILKDNENIDTNIKRPTSFDDLPQKVNKLERNANLFKQKMLERANRKTLKRAATIEKEDVSDLIENKDNVRFIY
jgi:hypothetical protein